MSVEQVARWIGTTDRLVVLTGAGMSTGSGIPDYRGPQGVWTKDPAAARMSTRADYLADPDLRARAWRNRRAHAVWDAEPNAAHRALVDLERQGSLDTLLTQNIDGLHQRAGSDPARVVELHGTIREAECVECGRRTDMRAELARVQDEPDPPCRACGGILTSATIAFGMPLEPAVVERAVRAARSAGVFLAAGSSLSVQPAAGLCRTAKAAGATLVVVNADPTPYDGIADAVLRDDVATVLPAIAARAAMVG